MTVHRPFVGRDTNKAGWNAREKIDALTAPGHQYMGGGDAEIEVSFLEYLSRR